MRRFLVIVLTAAMCWLSYNTGAKRAVARVQEEGAKTEICWGDVLMENYVLDVVDESDFWEVCDSTAFNCYEELTSEWYLAVCLNTRGSTNKGG